MLRPPSRNRAMCIGTGLAKTGHAHQHEARIELRQFGIAQAPAFERAWPIVLDHDVSIGHHAAEQCLPFRARQGQRDQSLVARDHFPPQRASVLHRCPVAHWITDAGLLDLDDIGAKISEMRCRQRAGNHRSRVQHAQALQWALAIDAAECGGQIFQSHANHPIDPAGTGQDARDNAPSTCCATAPYASRSAIRPRSVQQMCLHPSGSRTRSIRFRPRVACSAPDHAADSAIAVRATTLQAIVANKFAYSAVCHRTTSTATVDR
jgi:hypothetical protein